MQFAGKEPIEADPLEPCPQNRAFRSLKLQFIILPMSAGVLDNFRFMRISRGLGENPGIFGQTGEIFRL